MTSEAHIEAFMGVLFRVADDPAVVGGLSQSLRVFFHDARNHLNAIRAGLYLGRRTWPTHPPIVWNDLDARYAQLEQLVVDVQLLCSPRSFAPYRANLSDCINEGLPRWRSRFAVEGRTFVAVESGGDSTGDLEPRSILDALDALICWRAPLGNTADPAELCWGCHENEFRIDWHEPNVVLCEMPSRWQTSRLSLAMPLLKRVMKSHAGDLNVSYDGALRIGLRWPNRAITQGSP